MNPRPLLFLNAELSLDEERGNLEFSTFEYQNGLTHQI